MISQNISADQSLANAKRSGHHPLTQNNPTGQQGLDNDGGKMQLAQDVQQINAQQTPSTGSLAINFNQQGSDTQQKQSTPIDAPDQQHARETKLETLIPNVMAQQQQPPSPQPHQPPFIKPLLENDNESQTNQTESIINVPTVQQQEQSQNQLTPQKSVVTRVKLTDELNLFDWSRTRDIINQIAERAKSSVDSVITTLDPGMKEYLYSGGNVNIMVISDSNSNISPIRDAFQYVFGRATVISARCTTPSEVLEYPVKIARGFNEALEVALNRIKKLRSDTNNVPQNQVVVVLQPTIVSIPSQDNLSNGDGHREEITPRWFVTYCLMIEDPVLGKAMSAYSQLIPIDSDVVELAQEVKLPDDFSDKHLGFAKPIHDLMTSKLEIGTREEQEDVDSIWMHPWAGLDGVQIVHQLGLTLANSYRRKWNVCVN